MSIPLALSEKNREIAQEKLGKVRLFADSFLKRKVL
jgi:hypothetical protein